MTSSDLSVIDYSEILDTLHNDFHILTTSVNELTPFVIILFVLVFLIFLRDMIWR